ncbi:MltA domain-containing protein [Sedimentisphaera salicampi]|uniref:MltA domain-containing protein n=1 Tax=Sedimentisphaera salicampi TaxID=1941349 RepID=UPI000B9C8C28|nr:MltA domain-containing protein [Sedimentisphaera salicampi]OXU15465.1 Membrane-bound lytic murein transglycosylase A precursor [Sedimentisphaera salicampi]
MKRLAILACAAGIMLLFTGCKTVEKEEIDYNAPLLPGEDAFVKITDPAKLPDFRRACRNLYSLEKAIDNSLNYLAKPSSENHFPMQGITHSEVKESLNLFKDIIHSGLNPAQMSDRIKSEFDVYMSVGCDKRGTVLFTGYYTPIFSGSFEKTERFKYPLYKSPDDLVKADNGQILGRENASGEIVPYPPRRELVDSGMLDGLELIYLEDPFEVYIAHVQGSAKIKLPDGRLITVGYDATNGHEYKSISEKVSSVSGIPMDEMSLRAMIDYFSANTGQVEDIVAQNPRFVFFRKSEGLPHGSINEPVTRMRTIATDKSIFPRAALTFLDTSLPRLVGENVVIYPYQGFMLDQDTGGAIRAPGRCDVYMGQGAKAGEVAGKTYEEGKLYYLIAK